MTEALAKYFMKGGHPLGFTDKSLQCSDCHATFTFTADEQEFYANKGYANEPTAALPAAKPGKLSPAASVGTRLAAKCIPQCVSSVLRNVKCLSSLERAGRYIVVTATTRSNRAASRSLVHLDSMGTGAESGPRRFRGRRVHCISMSLAAARVWS